MFVAAFDFGSTYSGYACSAHTMPLQRGKWEARHLSLNKAPTSILINKHKEFVAFGFDAEKKYLASLENYDSDDSDQDTNGEYRYFDRFKMELRNQVNF